MLPVMGNSLLTTWPVLMLLSGDMLFLAITAEIWSLAHVSWNQKTVLENPRDGGAWWAAVYGVTQSRTQLK